MCSEVGGKGRCGTEECVCACVWSQVYDKSGVVWMEQVCGAEKVEGSGEKCSEVKWGRVPLGRVAKLSMTLKRIRCSLTMHLLCLTWVHHERPEKCQGYQLCRKTLHSKSLGS